MNEQMNEWTNKQTACLTASDRGYHLGRAHPPLPEAWRNGKCETIPFFFSSFHKHLGCVYSVPTPMPNPGHPGDQMSARFLWDGLWFAGFFHLHHLSEKKSALVETPHYRWIYLKLRTSKFGACMGPKVSFRQHSRGTIPVRPSHGSTNIANLGLVLGSKRLLLTQVLVRFATQTH